MHRPDNKEEEELIHHNDDDDDDDVKDLTDAMLPAEIICYIFMYCPADLDLVLSRVCRRWRCLINEGTLIRRRSLKGSQDVKNSFLRLRIWAVFHGNMKLLRWVEADCWQQRQSVYGGGGGNSSSSKLPGILKAPTDLVCSAARNLWETWSYTVASLTSGIHSQRYENAATRFANNIHKGRTCAILRKAAIQGQHVAMLQRVFADDDPQMEDLEWAVEMDATSTFWWLWDYFKHSKLTESNNRHQLQWFAVLHRATNVFHDLTQGSFNRLTAIETESCLVRAIRNGDLPMATYILELNPKEIGSVLRRLYLYPLQFMEGRTNNMIGALKHQDAEDHPFISRTWLCYSAVMHRQDAIQQMTWLHKVVGAVMNTDLAAEAAMRGNLEVLSWLARNKCPFDAMAPLQAARWNRAEALEFLIAKACPWHEVHCAQVARRRGYTEILAVIRKYGVLELTDYYTKPTPIPRRIVYPKVDFIGEADEAEAYKVWLDQHPELREVAAAET